MDRGPSPILPGLEVTAHWRCYCKLGLDSPHWVNWLVGLDISCTLRFSETGLVPHGSRGSLSAALTALSSGAEGSQHCARGPFIPFEKLKGLPLWVSWVGLSCLYSPDDAGARE